MAQITGRTPAACRQLASSARRRVRVAQTPATPIAQQVSLVRDFKRAFETGDVDAIIGVLDPAATLTGDGGAVLGLVEGADQVAYFLAAIANTAPRDVRLVECKVNGQPGLAARQNGHTLAVCAFEVAGDQIIRIWTIFNPDKLGPWLLAAESSGDE